MPCIRRILCYSCQDNTRSCNVSLLRRCGHRLKVLFCTPLNLGSGFIDRNQSAFSASQFIGNIHLGFLYPHKQPFNSGRKRLRKVAIVSWSHLNEFAPLIFEISAQVEEWGGRLFRGGVFSNNEMSLNDRVIMLG